MTDNVTCSVDVSVVHRLMSDENFANMWLHVLLLLLVMGVGVPGNVLVVSVFFRTQRRRRQYNSTQLLVLALALNDLTVCLLLLPFDLYRLRHFYSLRDEASCDVFEYLRNLNICMSCFLLTATAVERYRAICSDVHLRDQSRRGTMLIIGVVLVVSLLLSSPTPTFLGIEERVVSPMLVAHFSGRVQKAYRQVSGQAVMFSCEYLDQYNHTWGLRLFGLSSLLLFLAVVVVSTGSYGKIYHKIKANHISLHTALNKVAPATAPSGQPHSVQGEHGHSGRFRKAEGNRLQERPACPHGRSPVGIFTISDRERCSGQSWSVRRQSGHGAVWGHRHCLQGRPFPQPLLSEAPERDSLTPLRKPSRGMSESVLCSDEKDIDVTVNARDDVMSPCDDERSRTVLADVLSELQSVTDDVDDDTEDVEDCHKPAGPCGSNSNNPPSSAKTGPVTIPVNNRIDSISRISDNCQRDSLLGSRVFPASPSQPNCDIFTVSGKQSGSLSGHTSVQEKWTWKREKKRSKVRLSKPGHRHDSEINCLASGIDQRVAPAGMSSRDVKKKSRNVTMVTVNECGHPESSGCGSGDGANSRRPPGDKVTSPQNCSKRVTSPATQNCYRHIPTTGEVGKCVISANTEKCNQILTISKESDDGTQTIDTNRSSIAQDADARITPENASLSRQKPELLDSARNLTGRSFSRSQLHSFCRQEEEKHGLSFPGQTKPFALETRPSPVDSTNPQNVLVTEKVSFRKTSSTQFKSEYEVQSSSSNKIDSSPGPTTYANCNPIKSINSNANYKHSSTVHETSVQKESTIVYRHQQSESSNTPKSPAAVRSSHTLNRSTRTVTVDSSHSWQQQTKQLRIQNNNGNSNNTTTNTETRPRTKNSQTDNSQTTPEGFLSESRGQNNKLRASVRVQNSHNARFSRQIRVAKLLLVVTGTFLMSFVPFWALTVVYMVKPHLDWQLSLHHRMFMSVLYQSYFINNAANPVLFALYSPEFRSECRLLLKNLKQKFCG